MKYKKIVSCLLIGSLVFSSVGVASASDVFDSSSPISDVGGGGF